MQESYALTEGIVGVPLFSAPLVGCAAADDPYFQRIHDDEAILGSKFVLPHEWLPGAKSVLSICYPFSAQVRESNYENLPTPSDLWLHGRIEGHDFIHATDIKIAAWLESQGYRTFIPALSDRVVVEKRSPEEAIDRPMFTSEWSERHVAFVAGLGTFGLCTHLITKRGKAMRLGSIITDAPFDPTPRPYKDDPFAYCTKCGACAKQCPIDALSLEDGKNFQTCWEYLEETKIRFKPRYGCGKCQLEVPCETRIPAPEYAYLNE
ncbi:MAG: 4Fe-4S binding protein [Coriobacteriia bacterium]|nr:4Fe-4S binding protein [Coriobacteriia bacterium]